MKIKAEWHGFDALKAEMQLLTKAAQGQALAGALRSAAVPIAREARKNAPSKRVKKAITTVTQRFTAATKASARIGARKGVKGRPAKLAPLLEFGTRPHEIRAKRKKVLTFGNVPNQGKVFGRVVHHPGIKARPWLRPALDTKHAEAEHEFALALQRQVTKLHLRMLKRHAARSGAGG